MDPNTELDSIKSVILRWRQIQKISRKAKLSEVTQPDISLQLAW